MSRLIRYGASASVSVISKKLFPPPPRPSFSSITTSYNIKPETLIPCSAYNTFRFSSDYSRFRFMLSRQNFDCYSISDYNNLFSSLHKTGHDYDIIELAQLWEKSLTYNNVFPNIDTWKILINCYCLTGKSGDISLAFSLFRQIINAGHCPTTSTLNDLFEGLCRRGLIYKAIMFYNYTVLKGFQLNHKTYFILIKGLCEIGETKLAIHFFREALQIHKELIKQMGETKRETKTVIQLLNEVLQRDMQGDKEQKCDALAVRSLYELIILRLCRDGLLKEAHDLLSEMINIMPDPCTSTYSYLIYGYCINGQFKQAIALFKELGKILPVDFFRELPKNVSTLVTEQEVKTAKRAAAVLIKRGVRPDLAGYQSVRGGLFSGGRVKVARYVEDMSLSFSIRFGGKLY